MPTFQMPTIRQVWQLMQQDDYVSLGLKDAYFPVPSTRQHCKFLHLVWQNNLYEGMVLPFGWQQSLGISLHLLNPYCSFTDTRDILVPIHSKYAGKRTQSFYAPYRFVMGYILIFASLNLALLSTFLGLF